MEMLLHFMVAFFFIFPGFLLIGFFVVETFAFAMESKNLSVLGQMFCPLSERKEMLFSERFDTMCAEDEFFGDDGIDNGGF